MDSSRQKVFDPARDIPDLSGKVVIVTGGNSGLGYETVKQLYAHNAKVYLACRSEQKANDAITRMKAELQVHTNKSEGEKRRGEVVWLSLDLNNPKNAKATVEDFLQREQRLDVLVNNAGTTSGSWVIGPETCNIQRVMMVNHLSPFFLTLLLLPLLIKTSQEPNSDVRIINISSNAVKNATFKPGRLHFRSIDDFNDRHKDDRASHIRGRYAMSKVANALYTTGLRSRFKRDGVKIVCAAVDPGHVDTEGIRNVTTPSLPKGTRTIYRLIVSAAYAPVSKGSLAQIYASTSPDLLSPGAANAKLLWVLPDCRIGPCLNVPVCEDEALAQELWVGSLKVLQELGVDCGGLPV